MSRPLTRDSVLSPAWPLPLHLLRTAWADQPFDDLTGYVSGLAGSHLLDVVGEPVRMLDGLSPAGGPAGLLPALVTTLRRAGREHPAPEVLSLLTTAPGDSSSLPPIPSVRADVADAGWGFNSPRLLRHNRCSIAAAASGDGDQSVRGREAVAVELAGARQPKRASQVRDALERAHQLRVT